jgi:hypothetical protein
MTRAEANHLLNAVRGGFLNASEPTITHALQVTGDIDEPAKSEPQPLVVRSYLNAGTRVMREVTA